VVAAAAGLDEDAVEVLRTVGSTNLELMSRPLELPGRGVLLAGMQVAGRGRRGRVFLSDPENSITMSVACDDRVVPGAHSLSGLSIALGVAVARVLSRHVDGIGLKWPNDLLRDGRKVGGMLIETRLSMQMRRIVVGLGLNLRMPTELARQIGQPVGGLFDDRPMPLDRDRLAGELAGALLRRIDAFVADGFGQTAHEWAEFDVLAGREVSVVESDRATLVGTAMGIGADGSLILRTGEQVVEVSVGDVSARLGDLRGTTQAPPMPLAGAGDRQ
jgi:BirA family biotin operon repressor/biotin-[acetyl-CoA-carboxylase] ligase